MGDLSKHFNRSEFACSCGCGSDTVDAELISVLEEIRTHFERPVVINSGVRCEKHNAGIGGAPKSKHVVSKAADIDVVGIDPFDVYQYLNFKYPEKYGIGKYSNWTHIDVRPNKARW